MRALLALCCTLLAGPAVAQQVTLDTPPTLRCLMPAEAERGEPEYPYTPLKQNQGGRVKVELIFATPDKRPEVKVLESEGGDAFVDAVMQHVRQLRTPCLQYADIPARLQQEYVFLPDKRKVVWTAPADPDQERRNRQFACLVVPTRPEYPGMALRAQVQGRVLVEVVFRSADQPPEVNAHAMPNAEMLRPFAEGWARGYRLPCHEGSPLRMTATMIYRFEDDDAYGFNRLSFMQYLRSIRGLEKQRVRFDTQAMGCPFDIKLQYRKPVMANVVGEVGDANPDRKGLLEWLAQTELELNRRQLAAVFGDTVTLTIPCIKLNLTPKE